MATVGSITAGHMAVRHGAGAAGVMVSLFLFFSLFPYLQVIPLPSDTQPTGIVLAVLLFVLARRRQTDPGIWALGALMLTACTLFLLGPKDISAIRNIVGYLSLFFFAYMFHLITLEQPERMRRIVEIAIYVWFAVGLLQVLIGRDFLTFLIAYPRTAINRGVTSLAPEPGYFGSQMLFLLLMHLMLGVRRWMVALCVVSILLLALSTQVFLIVLLALAAALPFALGKRGLWLVIAGLALAALAGFLLFEEYKSQIRILTLIDLLIKNPSGLLLVDASANERFAAIYVSFQSFFDNYMLPHGISGQLFFDRFLELKRLYPEFLWSALPNTINLSGAGRLAFELGFGLFLFVGVAATAFMRTGLNLALRLFVTAAYFLLLVSAIPLAHPLLGAVIGVAHARRRDRMAASQ